MSKKIIIIGAGIAGLSAACYARMNGYDAEVYEMHDLPGGLCTSWKRYGYTIDGSIHWLMGSKPGTSFYRLWKELGAVQDRKMYYHDAFYIFIDNHGQEVTWYRNADKLEEELKSKFPEDEKNIELLCNLIRKFSNFPMPIDKPYELYSIFDFFKMMKIMRPFFKDLKFSSRITIGEFAERFSNPALRELVSLILGERDFPLISLLVTLGAMHAGDGGFPQGGSLEFAKSIEKRCLELGAKIHYRSKVVKILESGGKAVGIVLENGEKIKGDYIISAADLRITLYDLLDGKHIHPKHRELFEKVKLFPSMVQVSFGVGKQMNLVRNATGIWLKTSREFFKERKIDWLLVKDYSFDPSFAPPGKSVITAGFASDDYKYWEKLSENKEKYAEAKEKIADEVIEEIEKLHPGFKSSIEVVDVATPITYNHYTGNWKGTFMTWIITPDKEKKFRNIPKTLPGLDNFWLTGMWVQPPGGIPSVALSSRHVIQMLCKKDKKQFHTSVPAI